MLILDYFSIERIKKYMNKKVIIEAIANVADNTLFHITYDSVFFYILVLYLDLCFLVYYMYLGLRFG